MSITYAFVKYFFKSVDNAKKMLLSVLGLFILSRVFKSIMLK